MRIEEAMNLKKGALVRATRSSVGPYAIQEGKIYSLLEDARCLYPGRDQFSSDSNKPLKAGDLPINVFLSITDDHNYVRDPAYHGFEVATGPRFRSDELADAALEALAEQRGKPSDHFKK